MYFGTNSVEGVYFGSFNADKIYLGTTVVYEKGGSTDTDITTVAERGQYSGFSDDNYISIPVFYTNDMTSFEETVAFSASNISANNQGILDTGTTGTTTRLTLTSDGYLRFRVSSDGGYNYFVDITGSTPIELNTKIYGNVAYDSTSGYTLKHSYDNATWITDGTSSATTRPTVYSNNNFRLGRNNAAGYPLTGDIYLAETLFKLNGNTVFNGDTAVAGTDYTVVGTLTTINVTNISEIGLTTGIVSADISKVYSIADLSDNPNAIGLTTGIIGATVEDLSL